MEAYTQNPLITHVIRLANFFKAAVLTIATGSLFRSVFQVVTGNLAVSIISVITSVLLARWVSPSDMGIWNTANLFIGYSAFISLGVFSGLNRQLPFLIGQGKSDEANSIAETAYSWAVFLLVLTIVVTAVCTGWFLYIGQTKLAFVALATGFLILCSWITLYLTVTYRTSFRFGRMAKNDVLISFIGLLLMFFVWKFSFYGNLIRASLVAFLAVLILYYRRPILASPRWNIQRLFALIKIGFPIYLIGQLAYVFYSLDRLALVNSTKELGYFTISLQIGVAVKIIPTAFSVVVYPKMSQEFGETRKALEIWKIARQGALAAMLLGLLVGIFGWFLTPYFVRFIFPNYLPGIDAARWMSFLGFTVSLMFVFDTVFNVIRRQDMYLVEWIVGVIAFWVTWWALTLNPIYDRLVATSQATLLATLFASITCACVTWWTCKKQDTNQNHTLII